MMHELLGDAANVDTSASQACTSTTQEGKQPHHLAESTSSTAVHNNNNRSLSTKPPHQQILCLGTSNSTIGTR